MTPQRTLSVYMQLGLCFGPLGLFAAYMALRAVQPEPTILGVVVPFKRSEGI